MARAADATPVVASEVAWSDPVAAGGTSALDLVAPEGEEVVDAILFSGRPIREPVVARGPLVMNTAEEIDQAFRDFRSGRFGPLPVLARL